MVLRWLKLCAQAVAWDKMSVLAPGSMFGFAAFTPRLGVGSYGIISDFLLCDTENSGGASPTSITVNGPGAHALARTRAPKQASRDTDLLQQEPSF